MTEYERGMLVAANDQATELRKIADALTEGVASWKEFQQKLTDYHGELHAAIGGAWDTVTKRLGWG